MEYNTQMNKDGNYNPYSSPVNSTIYQFFINNGTILDVHNRIDEILEVIK